MKVIWKYGISQRDKPTFHQMPAGGKILSLQLQHGEAQIWVLVDPDKQLERRQFQFFLTGQPIEGADSYVYIGTIQISEESFVLHLFEIFPVRGAAALPALREHSRLNN